MSYHSTQAIDAKLLLAEKMQMVDLPAVIKRIGEAAEHGDLSENSEWKFAIEERDFLSKRLQDLQTSLSAAVPLDEAEVPTDVVGVGSKVTFKGSKTIVFRVLGPFDSNPDGGVISYESPFGQTLLGKKRGDVVIYQGEHCEITSIENGLMDYELGKSDESEPDDEFGFSQLIG